MQHLARLVAHLQLLKRVPVRLVELVDVRNQIVHELMLERLHRQGLALRIGVDLVLQLVEAGSARAGRRLIGGRDQALQALRLMERRDSLKHDRRRAVRIRDDSLVPVEVFGVHLRHHQRNLGILTKRAGVVDHLRARLDAGVLELKRDVRLAGEEDDVQPVKAVLVRLQHMIRLAQDLLVALARGKHLNLSLHRELAFLQDLDHLGADGTDANQTNFILFHEMRSFRLSQHYIKKP